MSDLDRITAKLTAISSGMFITKGLQKTGIRMERTAKQLAPVDDGQLRQSITYEIKDTQTNKDVTVGTNVEYGPYQEYGTGIYAENGLGRQTPWKYQDAEGKWHYTKGNKPHPFLRPAFAEHKDKAVDDIRSELRKEWEDD